jgi:hypothetical protein
LTPKPAAVPSPPRAKVVVQAAKPPVVAPALIDRALRVVAKPPSPGVAQLIEALARERAALAMPRR